MRFRRVLGLVAVGLLVPVGGCAAESYSVRMQFLDEMSAKGIEYRGQLQQQKTSPDEAACKLGWNLLDPSIPYDRDLASQSPEWKGQVEEAYVKSCMTGKPIPKPDPSGISARTPVPFSGGPSTPAPAAR